MASVYPLLSNIVPNQDIAADGINTFDLGVNPLSVLLLRIRPLNDTGTLTAYTQWAALCAALNNIVIRHQGQAIVSMRGLEAAALAVQRHNFQPWLVNPADTNDEEVEALLPIFMGRRAYDPSSCFPAVRRGELQLEIDVDDADTGYNDLDIAVDALELLGASPKEWERKVQIVQTFVGTGERANFVDLPLGNVLRGLMLFGTTAGGGASPAPSWGRVSLEADGVPIFYSAVDWQTLYGLHGLRAGVPPGDHVHGLVDGTPNTIGLGAHVGESYENRCYMDLDPMNDDSFAFDASKAGRLRLSVSNETADAVRVVPVERMRV